MSKINHALPLDQVRLDWPPRTICLIMTFIATLALCLQATLGMIVAPWEQATASHMTLEIVPRDGELGPDLLGRIQGIMASLRALPAVQSADVLSEASIRDLLAPWLLEQTTMNAIPLPVLIDITLHAGQTLNKTELVARVPELADGANINDHTALTGGLIGLAFLVQLACWAVVVLTIITLMLTIITVCRINLQTQRPTIALVQTLGGTDEQIAGMFARYVRRLCVPSSLAGFALGLMLAMALTAVAHAYGFHQVLVAGLSPRYVALMLAALLMVPVVMVTMAPLAARFTVRRLLRQ